MRIGTSEVLDHSNSTMSFSKSQGIRNFILYSAIIVMAPILALLFSAVSEAAGPWKGQIVEKETGKPLEGVVVLAIWERHLRGVGVHGSLGGYGASEEVITDEQGRFTIESQSSWTWNPFVYLKGPRFYIFKPGYGRWQFQGEDAWSKDTFERQAQQEKAWERFEEGGASIEIPQLKSRKERFEFYQSPGRTPATDVPGDQMKHWKTADNAERAFLGIQ